jgi:hypothetical protein
MRSSASAHIATPQTIVMTRWVRRKLGYCLTDADADAASAAAAAWDLPALNQLLRGHLTRLGHAPTAPLPTGAAALRELNDLLAPVLVDMLRAPMLPTLLQPDDWVMPQLRAAVGRVSAALHPPVAEHVAAVLAA